VKIVRPGHIPLLKDCSSAKHVRRGHNLKIKQRPARYVQQGPTHGQPDNRAHLAQPERTGNLLECGSAPYVRRGQHLQLVQRAAGKLNLFHHSWAIHIVLRTANMTRFRESSSEAPYVAAYVPTGNFFTVLRARYFPHLLYSLISFALSFISGPRSRSVTAETLVAHVYWLLIHVNSDYQHVPTLHS
jgi:hypothetical protein